jgi:preprotein translocase subunit SecY
VTTKICPSPSCPSRKRTGHPAEYASDRERCADCGAALIETPEGTFSLGEQREASPIPRSLVLRVAVTLALLVLQYCLGYIPIPGVDLEALRAIQDPMAWGLPRFEQLSLGALGLVPFIFAAQLVEIATLAVPRWRPLRIGGPAPRAKLHLASLLLALAIGVVQSTCICTWLEQGSGGAAHLVVAEPGPWFRVVATFALNAGVFLTLGIAGWISRFGMGNGVSLLLAWSALLPLLAFAWRLHETVAGATFLWWLAAAAAVVAATVWIAHRTRGATLSEGLLGRVRIRLPACGLVPLTIVAHVLFVPVQLANLGLPLQRLADWLVPGRGYGYLSMNLLLSTGLGLLLSFLFYRPRTVFRFMEDLDVSGATAASGEAGVRAIDRAVWKSAFLSVGFLWGLVLVGQGLSTKGLHMNLGAIVLLTLVALDLRAEWSAFRVCPQLIRVWELHRLYAVDTLAGHFADQQLEVHYRGLHHRSLLHFFGPYVPVELMVAPEDAPAVREYLL